MSVSALTSEQIQQQFVNYLLSLQNAPVTDYNIGSVMRLLGSGQSNTLEALYAQVAQNLQEAIPGVFYQMLQFPPLPAVAAYTQETFVNATTTSVTLNAGALLTIPNSTLQYSLQTTVVIPAAANGVSGSAQAIIVCTTPGSVGNAPANSITQLVSPITGITVTNTQALITGAQAETADQRAARFQNHLAKLHKGDYQALEAGALTSTLLDPSGYITERVAKAQAIDGTYIANPTSAPVLSAVTPGTATTLQAGTYMVGYTQASASGETTLSPTATVTITAGQAIQVSAITLLQYATGINYYLSQVAGSSVLLYDANGTGAQMELSALPLSGAASPPSLNGAYVPQGGYATVWGYNGVGPMSSTLLSQTQQIINGYVDAQGIAHTGYKAAGVYAPFNDATEVALTLAISVLPAPGYTLGMITGAVTIAVQGVFAQLDIGLPLYLASILYAVRQVPGVANAVITSPAADQAAVNGVIYTMPSDPTYAALS